MAAGGLEDELHGQDDSEERRRRGLSASSGLDASASSGVRHKRGPALLPDCRLDRLAEHSHHVVEVKIRCRHARKVEDSEGAAQHVAARPHR